MSPRRLRLFFALWPDPATRDTLASKARELRDVCGGRSPRADNLHITLAFLGSIAEHRVPALKDLAGAVAAAPFELDIARTGCWRAQRLVWAAPADGPPALTALHAGLAEALQRHGFPVERRAFKPHVTLLRDAVTLPPFLQSAMPALRWPVLDFVLASSEATPDGLRYRRLGQWPLHGAGR